MANNKQAHILFTTEADNEHLDLAESLRLNMDVQPFIAFEHLHYLDWSHEIPANTDAWIFTSKNAVKATAPFIKKFDEPEYIFAVGSKTSKALQQIGLEPLIPETFDAGHLAEVILKHPVKEAVHFRGNLGRKELADTLNSASVRLREIEVYITHRITRSVQAGSYDAIVFMSPSAVEAFLQKNTLPEHTPVYCIGPTTASTLKKKTGSDARIPQKSTVEALLKTIAKDISDQSKQQSQQ